MENKMELFQPFIPQSAIDEVSAVLKTRWIGQGPNIEKLENDFSATFNLRNTAAVITGTAALHLALAVNDIGPGDEVITTPQTCPATNHAILYQFAKPVFADIQYETGNIDPASVAEKITKKTKAIMCVDWAGYPCDLNELKKIAEEYNLAFIEDAAHALGAKYKGHYVGNIADCTCFSLQAIKTITTGDGGIICVNDDEKYKAVVRRRWYGVDRAAVAPSIFGGFNYDTFEVGYKYNMNNIAATIGVEQMKHAKNLLKRRKEIAGIYREAFENHSKVNLFESKNDRQSANWLFSMHVQERDKFVRLMESKGIPVSMVHTRNDKLKIFGGKVQKLPNMAKFSETMISIPIHHGLTDEQVDYIVSAIKERW